MRVAWPNALHHPLHDVRKPMPEPGMNSEQLKRVRKTGIAAPARKRQIGRAPRDHSKGTTA
eukprot:11080405-Alexandrium_andersonii.AAC.1